MSSRPTSAAPGGAVLQDPRRRHPAGLCAPAGHYAIRALMHQAALDASLDPDRLRFTRSLRIVRRQLIARAAFSP
jgi:hypothetical protein